MKKIRELWDSLNDLTTVSKRELFLEVVCCALAGFMIGILFSPKKTTIIGSNNGNGRAALDDEDAIEEID